MSEVMKPAGAWGWTVLGGKNPRNNAALEAAGEAVQKPKPKPKKEEEKKETKKEKPRYTQS